jgi:hypothetical protein
VCKNNFSDQLFTSIRFSSNVKCIYGLNSLHLYLIEMKGIKCINTSNVRANQIMEGLKCAGSSSGCMIEGSRLGWCMTEGGRSGRCMTEGSRSERHVIKGGGSWQRATGVCNAVD